MKRIHLLFLIFQSAFCLAQPNTEVYLFDINTTADGLIVSNQRNISKDPGYDNQPSFASNDQILFAANNKGQTDIAEYSMANNNKRWVHKGSASSQYSPQHLPGTKQLLSVHLDSTGYQRLFSHDLKTGDFKEAIPDLQIAYFAMYNGELMLATVLGDIGMDLILANLQTKTSDTLLQGAGRSIHKIPNTPSMSYTVVNEEGNSDVYLIDMEGKPTSYFICQLPIGIQDYTWLNDHKMLLASGTRLYVYDTLDRPEWIEVAALSGKGFKDITRMAVSPDGKKMVLVAMPVEE
jgi:hypothetical protein